MFFFFINFTWFDLAYVRRHVFFRGGVAKSDDRVSLEKTKTIVLELCSFFPLIQVMRNWRISSARNNERSFEGSGGRERLFHFTGGYEATREAGQSEVKQSGAKRSLNGNKAAADAKTRYSPCDLDSLFAARRCFSTGKTFFRARARDAWLSYSPPSPACYPRRSDRAKKFIEINCSHPRSFTFQSVPLFRSLSISRLISDSFV